MTEKPAGPRYLHLAAGGTVDMETASAAELRAALANVEESLHIQLAALESAQERLDEQERDEESGDLLYDEGLDAQDHVRTLEEMIGVQQRGVEYTRLVLEWREGLEARS